MANIGKNEFIALLAMITALSALAIDSLIPAVSEISREFSTKEALSGQVISIFVLGMAFGEILFGPLSDSFGRIKIINIGVFIFCIGSMISLLSTSYDLLLLSRFLQGFGASALKISSRALIRDKYKGESMARAMSLIFMVFITIPLIAPFLGQIIMQSSSWRYIFIFYIIYSVLIFVWINKRQQETLHQERRKPFMLRTLIKSSYKILGHTKIISYTMIAGLIFGVQLNYLSSIEQIMKNAFGIERYFLLYVSLNALSVGTAFFVNSKLVIKFGMQTLVLTSIALMFVIGFTFSIYFINNSNVLSLFQFMAVSMSSLFCVGIVFGNINAMAMVYLGHVAGLGASIIASLSSLVAFLVTTMLGIIFKNMISSFIFGLVICSFLALILMFIACIDKEAIYID